MTRLGYWWRAGVLIFVSLSAVLLVAGFLATQFDDQYSASPVVGRLLVGILAGAFVAAISAPVTVLVSAFGGGVAALLVGRMPGRRDRTKASR